MQKKRLSLVALLVSLLMVGGAIAYAQETSTVPAGPTDTQVSASGVTFPVAELGNCTDKAACKQYCNDSLHTDACIVFAQAHGLMNKDEAAQAKKFTQGMAKGGPGGCKTPQECESFCSNVANLEVCMSFAKKQGIKNDQVSQGEKLLTYIKSGGQTPGGCTSEADCRTYCGDFSHAEECFNFAKKAGIAQGGGGRGPGGSRHGDSSRDGGGDMPSPEQFQKFVELAKQGQTPGGCTSKDQCESYCQNSTHFEECTTFGEKVGFISHDEAAKIRQTGGKGPGGCDSPQSCQVYCNDQSHRKECFAFAEEHGFVTKQESQRAQEGFVQVRAGLDQAPPEVVACVKSTVGANVLDDIQSGKLAPGTDVGEQIKNCFEKFGERGGPQDMFKNAPPEVMACLKEKLGDKFDAVKSGKEMLTPEVADTFRVCFQSVQFQKGFGGEGDFRQGSSTGGPQGRGGEQGQRGPGIMSHAPSPQAIQDFVRSAPPGIGDCLKEKLGDTFTKIQAGEQVQGFDTSVMKSCFQQFRPASPAGGPDQRHFGPPPGGEGKQGGDHMGPPGEGQQFGPSQGGQGGFPPGGGFGQGGIPHEMLSCVKEKVGAEVSEEKIRGNTGDHGSLGQAIRDCAGKMRGMQQGGENNNFGPGPQNEQSGNQGPRRPQGEPEGNQRQQGFQGQQGQRGGFPESVLSCVKEKLGDAVDIEKLRRGGRPGSEIEKVIGECFSKTNTQSKEGELRSGEHPQFPPQGGFASGTPAEFRGDAKSFDEKRQPGGDDKNVPPRPGTGERQQFNPFGQNGQGPQQFASGTGPGSGQGWPASPSQGGRQFPGGNQGQPSFPPGSEGGKFQPTGGQGSGQGGGMMDQKNSGSAVGGFGPGDGSGQGKFGPQGNFSGQPGSGQGSFGGGSGQGQPNFPPGSEGGKFMGGPGSGMGGGGGQFMPGSGQGSQGNFGSGSNQPFQPQPGSGQGGQFNQQQFGPPSGSGMGGGFGGGQQSPSGGNPQPSGGAPGGAGSPPPGGSPGGGAQPPKPSSAAPQSSLLGIILAPFINLLGIGR